MPLIDANIFLEVELRQKRLQQCKTCLEGIQDGKIEAVTMNFILDTISILMDSFGCNPAELRRFHLSLYKYKGLSIYDLTIADRVVATDYMKKFKLDFDDATACAAMKALGISEILSMDKHFDKVPDIKRTEP